MCISSVGWLRDGIFITHVMVIKYSSMDSHWNDIGNPYIEMGMI